MQRTGVRLNGADETHRIESTAIESIDLFGLQGSICCTKSYTDRLTKSNVSAAADWLESRPQHQIPHPIIPEMKKLFGLTAKEAIEAIRLARQGR